MALTQDCLDDYTLMFKCKIGTLGSTYYTQLSIGSECTEKTLNKLGLAVALLDTLCGIILEEEECLTEEEICKLIDNLDRLLQHGNNCG